MNDVVIFHMKLRKLKILNKKNKIQFLKMNVEFDLFIVLLRQTQEAEHL